MRWSLNRMILAGCALLLAASPALAAAPELPVVRSEAFGGAAAKLKVGARFRLENVRTEVAGETRDFVLERFEVFAPGARITVHGENGDKVLPPPANIYFRGAVEGKTGSNVFLSKLEDGRTQGIISEDGALYLVGGDLVGGDETRALGGPLEMQRVDPTLLKASSPAEVFTCGNTKLPASPEAALSLKASAAAAGGKAAGVPSYGSRLAIETDFEFYLLFNNVTSAATYIGNLVGYASTVYAAELHTGLIVESVSLWSTSSDPWTQTSSLCSLMEFGKYWNQNRTGVPRTVAHFLSGKASGGGIAWVGVLCSGAFFSGSAPSCPGLGAESTNWGGGYGYTGNLFGGFNILNPTVVWDIYAFSHELGHNFGSPHSHCYNDLEGSTSPIDQCYSGECKQTDGGGNCINFCYNGGALSTPGPAGLGSGTIMSYCHLRSGSYGNITLTFGTNFGFGVLPGREATHMNSYLNSVAAGNPSCLLNGLFGNGFETGNMNLWQ